MHKVMEQTIDGQFTVTMEQRSSNSFRVSYGSHVKDKLDYVAAAKEYGECLMHAATCAGLIEE